MHLLIANTRLKQCLDVTDLPQGLLLGLANALLEGNHSFLQVLLHDLNLIGYPANVLGLRELVPVNLFFGLTPVGFDGQEGANLILQLPNLILRLRLEFLEVNQVHSDDLKLVHELVSSLLEFNRILRLVQVAERART